MSKLHARHITHLWMRLPGGLAVMHYGRSTFKLCGGSQMYH